MLSSQAARPVPVESALAYRLCAMPQLPTRFRTAAVLQLLARMENEPVTVEWLLAKSRLRSGEISALLEELTAQGCVEQLMLARPQGPEDSASAPLLQTSAARPSKFSRAIEQLRRAVGRERAWAQTQCVASESSDADTVPMPLNDARRR